MNEYIVRISAYPSNAVRVKAADTWAAARKAVKEVFLACRNDTVEIEVGSPGSCRWYRKIFTIDSQGDLS